MKTKLKTINFFTGTMIVTMFMFVSLSTQASNTQSGEVLIQIENLSPDGDLTFDAKCGGETNEAKTSEHKCGEGKCGEAKTSEAKSATAVSSEKAKTTEGKCGEGKCGEGKCGTD